MDKGQATRIDEIAAEVHGACVRIGQMSGPVEAVDPFASLLGFKHVPMLSN